MSGSVGGVISTVAEGGRRLSNGTIHDWGSDSGKNWHLRHGSYWSRRSVISFVDSIIAMG